MLILLALVPALARRAAAEDLKLLISVEPRSIIAPFAARVTLHLHNAGNKTLWLYRRARNPAAPGESKGLLVVPVQPVEGPTLTVRLMPEGNKSELQGEGEVFDSVGLPRPKLVPLAPGDDYEEKTAIRLTPAKEEVNGKERLLWGSYRFAVAYRARYSNAEEIERILGANIWQGEVESNAIEVELRPPRLEARGSIAGTVVGRESRPFADTIASLTDEQEHPVSQQATDGEGRFSFSYLPFGLYWVTVRRKNSTEDTAVFRHFLLNAEDPSKTIEFVLQPPETYEPKRILHKPVLVRVVDSQGRPLDRVSFEITWSSGTVLDSVKGRTSQEGLAAVELIPGRNFVTLTRKGCPKQEQRVDIAEGDGIDGFKMTFDCPRD